ncbi:MAG: hypothetical protein WBC91_14055 [Phototrophicaceae bacterium]
MELVLVMRVLQRRWWIIILPVIVAAIFAIPALINNEVSDAGGYQTQFSYSAAQESSNFDVRDGDYQDVWLASEFVVNAFTDWLQSTSFRAELALETGDDSLLNGLNIVADNNRSIGVVYMSHPNQESLTTLRDASIVVLETRNQSYFPHLGDAPAEVTIINRPPVVAAPPPVTDRFEPILQLGVALFAGIVLAGMIEYFDNTMRYRDEVEAQGLAVLASIPKHK